jgi:zinc protease
MSRQASVPSSRFASLASVPRFLPFLVAAIALLAGAASWRAAALPAAPPQPQPLRELRFPAFQQKQLANGLRLIAIERHTEPAVSLRLIVPAGKLYEPTAKSGLAGAAAALLTQGTATRKAQQIAAAIDGVGGELDAGSGADFAFVSAAVTTDQLDLALELMADVVLHPSFPADELERWRRKAVSGLELQRANPGYLAEVAFQRAVYGDFPYAYPQRGTPESLRALTRDDLVTFHRTHYLPNGAIQAPRHPAAELPRYQRRRVLLIDKPDAVQTQIRVGQAALAYTDPDFFTAAVYGTVLGGGSNGRLFQEIRRKRGLAYGAYSRFAEQLVTGSFAASTSTKTESTIEALRLTLELVAAMGKAPVPKVELDEAKTYLNGGFPLEIETADDVASRVLTTLSFGLGREFLDTYRDRISAVTAADVQRFGSTRLHPDQMVIVLVGKAAAFGPQLAKELGPYETIPAAEFDPLAPNLRRPGAAAPPPAAPPPKPGG